MAVITCHWEYSNRTPFAEWSFAQRTTIIARHGCKQDLKRNSALLFGQRSFCICHQLPPRRASFHRIGCPPLSPRMAVLCYIHIPILKHAEHAVVYLAKVYYICTASICIYQPYVERVTVQKIWLWTNGTVTYEPHQRLPTRSKSWLVGVILLGYQSTTECHCVLISLQNIAETVPSTRNKLGYKDIALLLLTFCLKIHLRHCKKINYGCGLRKKERSVSG